MRCFATDDHLRYGKMSDFDKAIQIVLQAEGNYSNNPADPGGETKYGISKRSYPNEDIKNLTLDRAKDIYYNDFWLPLQAYEFPEPVAILMFDMAVNMGKSAAVRCLQRAVKVEVDGIMGPVTRKALKENYGRDLVGEITVQRVMFYTNLETFGSFGLGWVRRSIRTVMEVLV